MASGDFICRRPETHSRVVPLDDNCRRAFAVCTSMNKRIAVVPAYNEAATVEAVLSTLYSIVDELIVVNDGSSDETGEIVSRWAASKPNAVVLTHPRNRGMS